MTVLLGTDLLETVLLESVLSGTASRDVFKDVFAGVCVPGLDSRMWPLPVKLAATVV